MYTNIGIHPSHPTKKSTAGPKRKHPTSSQKTYNLHTEQLIGSHTKQ